MRQFKLRRRSTDSIPFPATQPSNCGYSSDFDLSCDSLRGSLLYVKTSGLFFQVNSIDYLQQALWINDLDHCMHMPFFNHEFSLVGTPFQFSNRLENYTYFSCPSEVESIGPFRSIGCLRGYNDNVIAVALRWLIATNESLPSPSCRAVSTALLPARSSGSYDYYFGEDFSDVKLFWLVPDCSFCEETDRFCGLNGKRSQIVCSSMSASTTYGISKATKKKIAFGVLFTAGFMCIIVYSLLAYSRRTTNPVQVTEMRETNRRVRLQGLIAELSTGEVARGGFDAQIIESYKTTQLGESLELPDPNDNTCSICLAEYKPQETLRTIPECNHYFHVDCIDEWLSISPTCPLCRNLPLTHEASLVRRHEEPSIC